MKRLVSYLLLCVSILIAVFVSFIPTFTNVNASADYSSGREFIYQVSLKQPEDEISQGDFINSIPLRNDNDLANDIDDVVDEIKYRLNVANISNAVVEVNSASQNDDVNNSIYTIRVAYKAQYEQLYNAINEYLTFDWNLSAEAIQEDVASFSQNNDDGGARLFVLGEVNADYSTGLPRIRMPLANPQDFYDLMFTPVSENNSASTDDSTEDSETSEDTEETETPDDAYIYIVNDWKTTYSIEEAVGDNASSYYTDAVNNVLFRLDTTDPASFFEGYDANSESEDGYDAIFIDYSQFLPDLSNVTSSAVQQRLITALTNLEVAKLNSTPYNYEITLLNSNFPSFSNTNNRVPAFVEPIKQYGNLTFSTLIIASLIAFVLVSCFLILNYGLSAISSISITSAIAILCSICMSFFGVEFNIGTILGLICVTMISIFSATTYYKKVKEASYSGKNLKKANAEASKKTILFQLDVSIITLIFGIVGYLFDNTVIMSLGAILILGAIFNFIFNSLVLRGLNWLLCNSSYINEHLNLLRIKKELIPNLSNDEKPTYFETFKNQKINKKGRLICTIVSSILLVGSIIAIPLVNGLTGNLYGGSSNNALNTQVVITYSAEENDRNSNGFATITQLQNQVLNNIYVFDANNTNPEEKVALDYTNGNGKVMYYTKREVGDTTSNYYFTYIFNLDTIYDSETQFTIGDSTTQYDLESAISEAIASADFDNNAARIDPEVYIGTVENSTEDYLNRDILYFVLISVGISTVYVLIRFGLGKAIISLVYVGGTSTIAIGIFASLQTALASTNTLAILVIALTGYATLLYYLYKERDVLKDYKDKIKTLEDRHSYLQMSHMISLDYMLSTFSLTLILLISFIFSTTFANVVIVTSIVGLVFVMWTLCLLEPSEAICELTWNRTKSAIKINVNKKKKGKKQNRNVSDGPQEAIFIGIND